MTGNKMSGKVLIGITTHNRASILAKAIQSALDQDYSDKEVAVFDDGSTDQTPRLREVFPMVRWKRIDDNKGLVWARNYMMRETDAEFYFSLDDDAWFIKGDEVSQGIALMKERPEIAALAYDILSPDSPAEVERGKPVKTPLFIGCGHMLRLSAVRDVSFYTPGPGNYGSEESDLCVRLLDRGYEILHLPGVHVWHDKSLLTRKSDEQYASGVCNDLTFALRRCPFPMVVAALPFKMLTHLRFAIRNELVRSYIYGIGKFMRALPAIANSRKPVSSGAMLEFRRRARPKTLPVE